MSNDSISKIVTSFLAWANNAGYDTAHTYDTERSRWVFLSPMTADLWAAWAAALAERQVAAPADLVFMPQNADQAAGMLLLAHSWLTENAPDRLKTPPPCPECQAREAGEGGSIDTPTFAHLLRNYAVSRGTDMDAPTRAALIAHIDARLPHTVVAKGSQ